MPEERFLVTGCMGCLGAHAVKTLADTGTRVIGFDLTDNRARLRLLMHDAADRVEVVRGDLTDPAQVAAAVSEHEITHIVHLGALQIPFCRADPVRGAQVNVAGTAAVLEAARHSEGRVQGVALASSAAVFGPTHLYDLPLRDDSPLHPTSLYGAYKQAGEWMARTYAHDWQVGSVTLRPFTVYGPGRDQGMTSTPTVAMLAAAAGRDYRITFGGEVLYQLASDAARAFVEAARRCDGQARVYNMGGTAAGMDEVVAAIEHAAPEAKGRITFENTELPFPAAVDSAPLDAFLGGFRWTPLEEGVAMTIETFRHALDSGRISLPGTGEG